MTAFSVLLCFASYQSDFDNFSHRPPGATGSSSTLAIPVIFTGSLLSGSSSSGLYTKLDEVIFGHSGSQG